MKNKQKNEEMKELEYNEQKKSVGIGFLIGLFVTGGAQFYTGKVAQGFVWIVVMLFSWLLLLGWLVHIIAIIVGIIQINGYNDTLKKKLDYKY